MGKYLLDNKEKEYIYDLYATSNHKGDMHGGHYTACCKNNIKQIGLNRSSLDNDEDKWYQFNDSNYESISEAELVDSSAYILFYRLRE